MRQPFPSSSASSSTSTIPRIKKRKWTREQLLKNLEILGTLSAPLPPDLPPSPPASRAGSLVPGSKRKSDATQDVSYVKRPRTSTLPDRPLHPHHPPASSSSSHRHFRVTNVLNPKSEPSEDGELREEAVASSSRGLGAAVMCSNVPVRRPRRGRLELAEFDQIHDKYHKAGRLLKYSGDARFWSTYPISHKDYKPLLNPPAPDSPYHKYGGLIARLELIDALVCFTYSIWSKDYSRGICVQETWTTIEAFLGWCKSKWLAEEPISDREKAFIGLIWMIEAFIHGRRTAFPAKSGLDAKMSELVTDCKKLVGEAIKSAEQNHSAGSTPGQTSLGSHLTPPMLPSPASIAPTNSANSTPTNRPDGTPSATDGGNSAPSSSAMRPQLPQSSSWPSSFPLSMLPGHFRSGAPQPPHIIAAATAVTMPLGAGLIAAMKDQVGNVNSAAYCMSNSVRTLTLPIMARHFPNTFARMIHSTLLPNEEYEPDIEDEEGELFWPGQLITGEGLGWVCLMGKAMISEMGKEIGYTGLEGAVPKPKLGDQGAGSTPKAGSLPPRANVGSSTAYGHTSGASPAQGSTVPVKR